MHESFPLGRIGGIRIGANWSLLVVVWLIAWSLAATLLPEAAPGHSEFSYWLVGVAASVTFFACLLAHELSHSVVARRSGVGVSGIVLWLFGGVSQLEGDPPGARVEFRIAIAGPLASLALAGLFFVTAGGLDVVSDQRLLIAAIAWLSFINALLGVFNLLPAFPLDGGRVLRAWLWRRSGDKSAATVTAGKVGRIVAYVLIGFGIVQFSAGATLGGVWMVFLGWFLLAASSAEVAQSLLGTQLAGVTARDVMTPSPVTAPAHTTVQELLDRWLYPLRCSTFPIVDDRDEVVGLVTMVRIKGTPPHARDTTTVTEIACPPDAIVRCGPDEPVAQVIGRMNASVDQRALVFDGGTLAGIISPSDVSRLIERAELGQPVPVG